MGLTVPKTNTHFYGTLLAAVLAAPQEPALVGRGRRCNMLQEGVQDHFSTRSASKLRHDRKAGESEGAGPEAPNRGARRVPRTKDVRHYYARFSYQAGTWDKPLGSLPRSNEIWASYTRVSGSS